MSKEAGRSAGIYELDNYRTNPIYGPETLGQAAARLLTEMDRKKVGQEIGAKQPPAPRPSNGGIREVRTVTEKGKK